MVNYVLSFRERLKGMMRIVQEMAEAWPEQKSWYSKTAHSIGDKMVVFLSLKGDKLKVAWQGPNLI